MQKDLSEGWGNFDTPYMVYDNPIKPKSGEVQIVGALGGCIADKKSILSVRRVDLSP